MDNQDLQNLRHTASHLLAAAVLEFYPKAKITLGPPTDTGFYYDIDFGSEKISEEDLPKIEKKMKETSEKMGQSRGKRSIIQRSKRNV